ncbi:MAG: hypothetical protein IPM53_16330 [Anaerolineaceae bacterium]|nr:hypothetical protein [Anaerolineaceae bacterium]
MTKQKARPSGKTAVTQYILVGAGLGLYFGLFFRPLREPNFLAAVALALLAAAAVTILGLLKKARPTLPELGKTAVTNFIKFALVLALLEGRHYAFDLGGKWLVTAFTTVLGGLAGWWLAQSDK